MLTSHLSCIVSSIARLAYAVSFVKVNIEGDYAVNFDSMSALHARVSLPTLYSGGSEHYNVVWYRSMRLDYLRKSPVL